MNAKSSNKIMDYGRLTHACENVHVGHMASRMACKVEANQPFIYPTTEHLNYALVVMLIGS